MWMVLITDSCKRGRTQALFNSWPYLVELELSVSCVCVLELLLPAALEVDGVDQHQLGQFIQSALLQKILDLI